MGVGLNWETTWNLSQKPLIWILVLPQLYYMYIMINLKYFYLNYKMITLIPKQIEKYIILCNWFKNQDLRLLYYSKLLVLLCNNYY